MKYSQIRLLSPQLQTLFTSSNVSSKMTRFFFLSPSVTKKPISNLNTNRRAVHFELNVTAVRRLLNVLLHCLECFKFVGLNKIYCVLHCEHVH